PRPPSPFGSRASWAKTTWWSSSTREAGSSTPTWSPGRRAASPAAGFGESIRTGFGTREKGEHGLMAYDNLTLEQEGAVLYVTVNRPRVLNALNRATLGELEQVLAGEAAADDVRVVVFRGAGDRAFVAGADI